jgi:hypothetical protein
MSATANEYKNLIELLLGPIIKRPAMFLGQARISMLPNFIIGYNMGYHIAKNDGDMIEKQLGEGGFLDWLLKKKNIPGPNSWTTPFPDEANYDEEKAIQLLFKYLEEYNSEKI